LLSLLICLHWILAIHDLANELDEIGYIGKVSFWIGPYAVHLMWDGYHNDMIPIPYLLLAAMFIVLPARWIFLLRGRWREQGRRKAGLCVRCSYDLTGNTSGICPECGEKA